MEHVQQCFSRRSCVVWCNKMRKHFFTSFLLYSLFVFALLAHFYNVSTITTRISRTSVHAPPYTTTKCWSAVIYRYLFWMTTVLSKKKKKKNNRPRTKRKEMKPVFGNTKLFCARGYKIIMPITFFKRILQRRRQKGEPHSTYSKLYEHELSFHFIWHCSWDKIEK
jgi:hypothetical protein